MQLRQMQETDLEAVSALDAAAFPGAQWGTETLRQNLQASYDEVYVAEESTSPCTEIRQTEAAPLGFFIVRIIGDEAELLRIAVAQGVRGRGVGRALLRRLLAKAKARGAENVFLEVRKSNEAARRLYESEGFLCTGVRRNYYRNPSEDAVLMQKKFDEE